MSREPWDLSVDETERAVLLFEDLFSLCSQWGSPLDSDSDVKGQRNMHRGRFDKWQRGDSVRTTSFVVGDRPSAELPLFGAEFFSVVSDLVEKNRKRDSHPVSRFDVNLGVRKVFPVYRDGDESAKGFVLSSVDDIAGCRVFPVVVPADVVEFSLSLFGPAAYRIRFLSELAGIYGDAVRFLGQGDGLSGPLVASLRNLVSSLGIELGKYRDNHATDSSKGTDHRP